MANLVKNPNSMIGRKPTNSQKLEYVTGKLGIPGIAGMQGSSVNLFDTVALVTNAGRQTLTFFNQSSKSRNFSNFQQGKLPSGGSLVLEKVTFIYVLATTATLDDANVILAMTPISGVATALMPINFGLMNIFIANSQVVNDFNIYESNPSWNPNTTGIAAASATPMGANSVPLEAPPVLPPDQTLKITLEIPPLTAPAFAYVTCVVGRFGSLFAAKTTL